MNTSSPEPQRRTPQQRSSRRILAPSSRSSGEVIEDVLIGAIRSVVDIISPRDPIINVSPRPANGRSLNDIEFEPIRWDVEQASRNKVGSRALSAFLQRLFDGVDYAFAQSEDDPDMLREIQNYNNIVNVLFLTNPNDDELKSIILDAEEVLSGMMYPEMYDDDRLYFANHEKDIITAIRWLVKQPYEKLMLSNDDDDSADDDSADDDDDSEHKEEETHSTSSLHSLRRGATPLTRSSVREEDVVASGTPEPVSETRRRVGYFPSSSRRRRFPSFDEDNDDGYAHPNQPDESPSRSEPSLPASDDDLTMGYIISIIDNLPDGSASFQVQTLINEMLPSLAENENVQQALKESIPHVVRKPRSIWKFVNKYLDEVLSMLIERYPRNTKYKRDYGRLKEHFDEVVRGITEVVAMGSDD